MDSVYRFRRPDEPRGREHALVEVADGFASVFLSGAFIRYYRNEGDERHDEFLCDRGDGGSYLVAIIREQLDPLIPGGRPRVSELAVAIDGDKDIVERFEHFCIVAQEQLDRFARR